MGSSITDFRFSHPGHCPHFASKCFGKVCTFLMLKPFTTMAYHPMKTVRRKDTTNPSLRSCVVIALQTIAIESHWYSVKYAYNTLVFCMTGTTPFSPVHSCQPPGPTTFVTRTKVTTGADKETLPKALCFRLLFGIAQMWHSAD